jgi:hypothetical protein
MNTEKMSENGVLGKNTHKEGAFLQKKTSHCLFSNIFKKESFFS